VHKIWYKPTYKQVSTVSLFRGFTNNGRVIKAGVLKLFNPQDGGVTQINGVPDVVDMGQGGLGDIKLHPNFDQNKLIYLSYVERDPSNSQLYGAVVIRAQLDMTNSKASLSNIQRVWTQVPKFFGVGHYAYRILFDEHGKLWISSGERQEFFPAQDMNSNAGKILRLNDDGSLPSDNPFQNQGEIAKQVWSLGHRNALGMAFDQQQKLWVAEMGPAGGDEFNLITRAGNYGYPIVSEGFHYPSDSFRTPFLRHTERPEFIAPVMSWTRVISPSSLIFYKGSLFPQFKNKAIMGGLSSRGLVIVDIENRPVREIARISMNSRIRAITESKDGTLWILKDAMRQDNLLRLVPR